MSEDVVQEGKTLKQLEKEITCSICQEQYTEPKVLPCLHYYCKECITQLALRTASKKPFSCPECRKDTTLPEGGVEELKTAFFINRLISNFSALERVHSRIEATCEACISGCKAEAFCRQCAVFICKNCVESHKQMKVFATHKVVSLSDLKHGRTRQIAVAEPATKKCAIHEEPLLIYCFDCDSLVCRDCTVKIHKDHNFEFCKVASPGVKKTLLDEIVPLKESSAEILRAVDVVRIAQSKVKAQGNSVVSSIESSFNEMYQILEKRKSELVEEALRIVEEKVGKLSEQEKSLSANNTEILNIVEYTEQFVGDCSDNDVMSMHSDIRRKIRREKEEIGKLTIKPVEAADVGVEVRNGSKSLPLILVWNISANNMHHILYWV